ncbi:MULTISPECIES: hypothetical protein [unclassified Streptomyces]|uniref:hypothetical protein n=1 Tax=unclassified Streptomyces TaxID=2593676 RepID=UPI002B1CD10D|nr:MULTISPECIES: hypothetical protein [unclassified Streptomyces]
MDCWVQHGHRENLGGMGEASADRAVRGFLAAIGVGDLCSGTVTEVARSGVSVILDGFAARPLGVVWPLDLSWRRRLAEAAVVGQRITAEVIAVDVDDGLVRLSMVATENPELWAFLKGRRRGEILAGTVAAIERYGVFVALDEGPDHPVYPGVSFITYPELSWRRLRSSRSDSASHANSCSSTHGTERPDCLCGLRSPTPFRCSPTASLWAGHCAGE